MDSKTHAIVLPPDKRSVTMSERRVGSGKSTISVLSAESCCLSHGKTYFEYNPRCKKHREREPLMLQLPFFSGAVMMTEVVAKVLCFCSVVVDVVPLSFFRQFEANLTCHKF